MRIYFKALLILVLFSSCRLLLNHKAKRIGYEGYFDKNYEWVNTPSRFTTTDLKFRQYDSTFKSVPSKALQQIQSDLDSLIYSRHCYRFVYNADSSRFFALFVVATKNAEALAIARKNTIWPIVNTSNPVDSINYIGYVLWGINYSGKWYYLRDDYTSFFQPNNEKAKQYFEEIFLFQYCKFFKFYKETNQEEFWRRGGEYLYQGFRSGRFEPVTKDWTSDSTHVGLPFAVHRAKIDSADLDLRRNEYWKEGYILTQIAQFIGKGFSASNIIYNADTSKFLIQIAMPKSAYYNLEYYYFDWDVKELFLWTDEPVKPLDNLDKLDLYMELDISKRRKGVFALHTHKRPGTFWSIFKTETLKSISKVE